NMKDDAESGNSQAWMNWLATEKNIKQNLQRQAYTSLVKAGLGASLKEGERDYLFNNTKMDAEFVYVPYSTIADSLAYVSKQEIQKYLKDNAKRYKTEAARTIKYVKFDILPSEADDAEAKKLVESYIEDREEYSNAAKATVKIAGLKNTTKYESFLNDNRSDLAIDNGYKYKNQILAEISDEVFNAEVGTVVGPYKQNGYYKISKVVETVQMPDSVKSSHIIIPYAGTTRSTSLKTKEQAKKTADSVFALVKNNKSKFTEIADEINSDGTKGKGGDIGWVRKDQAFSPSFDVDFANFIYKNKVGSIDVVETAFGFHIIRIDDQTKAEEAVKLVTFARLVEASEETENRIFEEAETLNANLSEGKDIDEIATEKNYNVQTALNLKVLDEAIPGLGAQRQMVTWAFDNERELGNSKRFDIDINGKRGYSVAVLTGKVEKDGVAVSSELLGSIRPELVDKKKAEMIKKKMSGATLAEIATNSGVTVRKASAVNLASPLISGVGNEPGVVGAMSTIKLNEVSDFVSGEKGVFVFKVTKRDAPVDLENYDTFRKKLVTQLQARGNQIFNVLEETADIKDNRGKFF
ncbi:peptidylprolyl isomerase, partial [Lutibacter sp.]|uniref:peptidylprolyl isomerase n=1 Tax=Lutibacter sp. TaxID=1925666 RepID=UPI0034A04A2D